MNWLTKSVLPKIKAFVNKEEKKQSSKVQSSTARTRTVIDCNEEDSWADKVEKAEMREDRLAAMGIIEEEDEEVYENEDQYYSDDELEEGFEGDDFDDFDSGN